MCICFEPYSPYEGHTIVVHKTPMPHWLRWIRKPFIRPVVIDQRPVVPPRMVVLPKNPNDRQQPIRVIPPHVRPGNHGERRVVPGLGHNRARFIRLR